MIAAYSVENGRLRAQTPDDADIASDALWIDLVRPTDREVDAVNRLCSIRVPTEAEMGEIEVSSRLRSENDAEFMTAAIAHGLAGHEICFAPVTFILAGKRLITLRYSEPKSFQTFADGLCRENAGRRGKPPVAETLLIGLLEAVVDRVADMLEGISADLDRIATDIFSASGESRPISTDAFKTLLRRIGGTGDLSSRVRESLATLERMLPFLQRALDERGEQPEDAKARIEAIGRDIQSLNDFISFLSNKTTFLLDTTVGMISTEQNAIIKIFSVASVGFMPPTLVASIYGMNFQHMPELSWRLGYPFALGIMVLSGVLPLVFFRYKRWF